MPASDLPGLGLGTYGNTEHEQCVESVRTALEVGYRHVDTGQIYGTEAAVGEGIERADVDREDVIVATKVARTKLAADDVLASTRESLDRLGLDSIDLLYVHWPVDTYDPAETLPAFDRLRDEGLIRHVCLSNFTIDQLDEARDVLDAPLFAHQVEMHPLMHQDEYLEYARRHDHWLVAYAPLARGLVFDVPELSAIAEKHGVTEAQVSLAWLLGKDGVVTIPKATSEGHIAENWAAREVELDPEDVARIDAIEREESVIEFWGAPWN